MKLRGVHQIALRIIAELIRRSDPLGKAGPKEVQLGLVVSTKLCGLRVSGHHQTSFARFQENNTWGSSLHVTNLAALVVVTLLERQLDHLIHICIDPRIR